MDLLKSHTASFETLRAIALQCHALDIDAYHLFLDSTHLDGIEKTKAVYQEMLSIKLLNLAITLRTKFYQGIDHKTTIPFISHCAFLFNYIGGDEKSEIFSIKDICDKIIHADSISRDLENGVRHPTTSFYGYNPQRKCNWELSISVSLFTEAVLNWIHYLETNDFSEKNGD